MPSVLWSDWFLDDAQLKERGRGSSAVNAVRAASLVTPIIGAQAFYQKVHDKLAAMAASASKEDYVFLTGPAISGEIELVPGNAASKLGPLLKSIKEADVRVLLSGHPSREKVNDPKGVAALEAGEVKPDPKSTPNIVRDTRLGAFGLHHQRAIVVFHKGALTAYVGGPDLAAPDPPPPRGTDKGPRKTHETPVHAVALEIAGPAALDIDTNFRERWKDPFPPRRKKDESKKGAPTSLPPIAAAAPAVDKLGTPGTHNAQILRTFAERSPGYDFAPRGDYTLAAAYEKAIARAERLIYIEDQAFACVALAELLGKQLAKQPNLRVIVLVPKVPDLLQDTFGYWKDAAIKRLKRAASGGNEAAEVDRFAVYHLEDPATRKEICCHSSLMIVDDVWLAVGSARFLRRSLSLDSELAVAVVDGKLEGGVPALARQLRTDLWRAHLGAGLDATKLSDAASGFGFDEWARLAGAAKAQKHAPLGGFYDRRGFTRAEELWDTFVDPAAKAVLAEEEAALASVKLPPLLEENRRVGRKMLDAIKARAMGVATKDEEQIYELAHVGAYNFAAHTETVPDPSDPKKKRTIQEVIPDYNVCLTAAGVKLYDALVDAAIATKEKWDEDSSEKDADAQEPPFKLLSFLRKPGRNRGNHGRLLEETERTMKDALGRKVEGVASAVDIARFGGFDINIEEMSYRYQDAVAYTEKEVDEAYEPVVIKSRDKNAKKITILFQEELVAGKAASPKKKWLKTLVDMTSDDWKKFNEKRDKALRGVAAVLEILPKGKFDLGLPRLKERDLYRAALFQKVDLTVFITVYPNPDALKRKPGHQDPQKSPYGTYDQDINAVRQDALVSARKTITDALSSNGDGPKIRLLYPDDHNHLHITAFDTGDDFDTTGDD
ncbi:hypothetical protein WMF30_22235 [Sorangium sp. So ce134]